VGSAASFRSFFVCRLSLRVGSCNLGPRFAQSKAELAKQPLALSDAQRYAQMLLQERGQQWAIPKLGWEAEVQRSFPQSRFYPLALGLAQARWPSRALPFAQATKPVLIEPMHPILHTARRIA
jgi:hypothetical protein